MEYGIGLTEEYAVMLFKNEVLILVLMEYGLGHY